MLTCCLHTVYIMLISQQAYVGCRRWTPDDHPIRRDSRFEHPEAALPPTARTHEEMTLEGKTAATLQSEWRHGERGAKAKLDRHGASTGTKNESCTAGLPGRDDIKDQPIDGMHTLARIIGRLRDQLCNNRTVELAEAVEGLPTRGSARRSDTTAAEMAPKRRKGAKSQGNGKWSYLAVIGHRNGTDGSRTHYEVLWVGGERTWELADELLEDAISCESETNNVITEYETDLTVRQSGADIPGRSVVVDTARWVEMLSAVALPEAVRHVLDEGINRIPFNPVLFPNSARSPFTKPSTLTMRDTLHWVETYAEYQLRGQWQAKEDRERGRIIRQFIAVVRRLMSRSVTLRQIRVLEIDVPFALSEMEVILPPTEFSILVHVMLHLPWVLRRFGPLWNTWMFNFERRVSCTHSSLQPVCRSAVNTRTHAHTVYIMIAYCMCACARYYIMHYVHNVHIMCT